MSSSSLEGSDECGKCENFVKNVAEQIEAFKTLNSFVPTLNWHVLVQNLEKIVKRQQGNMAAVTNPETLLSEIKSPNTISQSPPSDLKISITKIDTATQTTDSLIIKKENCEENPQPEIRDKDKLFDFGLTDDDNPLLNTETLKEADQFLRINETEGKKSTFECLTCGSILKHRRDARFHVRRIHFNDRFYCSICTDKFYTNRELTNHKSKCRGYPSHLRFAWEELNNAKTHLADLKKNFDLQLEEHRKNLKSAPSLPGSMIHSQNIKQEKILPTTPVRKRKRIKTEPKSVTGSPPRSKRTRKSKINPKSKTSGRKKRSEVSNTRIAALDRINPYGFLNTQPFVRLERIILRESPSPFTPSRRKCLKKKRKSRINPFVHKRLFELQDGQRTTKSRKLWTQRAKRIAISYKYSQNCRKRTGQQKQNSGGGGKVEIMRRKFVVASLRKIDKKIRAQLTFGNVGRRGRDELTEDGYECIQCERWYPKLSHVRRHVWNFHIQDLKQRKKKKKTFTTKKNLGEMKTVQNV